jgi:hypothetical protein
MKLSRLPVLRIASPSPATADDKVAARGNSPETDAGIKA